MVVTGVGGGGKLLVTVGGGGGVKFVMVELSMLSQAKLS